MPDSTSYYALSGRAPFVFRISAFTSFKISFSERMYARGLYFMDFLKLIRFKHLIRYFFRSRKEPISGRRVPLSSVPSRQKKCEHEI